MQALLQEELEALETQRSSLRKVGGMLVLGAVGLFCLSGGELQAIKENRKQNRLAQKRRKNLLKADIVFCSCLFFGGSSITLRRRQRSYLVLIFSCSSRPKRRKQLRQERRSPQAPAVAVLGLLGQQSKAALDVCGVAHFHFLRSATSSSFPPLSYASTHSPMSLACDRMMTPTVEKAAVS